MKKEKRRRLHYYCITAFVILIVLGLACASTPEVSVTYTEPSRLNMSGINKIAIDSNDAQVASDISRRLTEGKFTVAPEAELQAWKQWRELAAYQAPAIETRATDLVAAYSANALRADSSYNGKVLKTSGVVREINRSSRGRYFVRLDAGRDAVDVYFASSELNKVAAIDKGKTIIVVGRCVGYTLPEMEDTAEILRLLGAGRSVNIIDAIFPVENYSGTIDAVVSVKKEFSLDDSYRNEKRIVNEKDVNGKWVSYEKNVTYYDRTGTLNINYQIVRASDSSIIGQGIKSATSRKYSDEDRSNLPSVSVIQSNIIEKPLLELANEIVPVQRTMSVTLLKEENNKDAKKEMGEAEKLVKAKAYQAAVTIYGEVYSKYKNFAAGYNHAVLTEVTEDVAAAVVLMEALANQSNDNLAKTTLADMQKRNIANQQATQQLSR
jgi:hypothetical protein